MKNWKDNIYFVLVEPGEPGNIGASARAIKNMGFRNLCLVNPSPAQEGEGRWFARNAHDVLDSAVVHDNIGDALRDKAIVAGTTRRKGKRRGLFFTAEEGAGKLYDAAQKNRVAVLFGREARGLFNEEVEECGFMLTIPSSPIQPSLNLSQAVLIVAYELSKAEFARGLAKKEPSEKAAARSSPFVAGPASAAFSDDLAGHDEIAPLYQRISSVLELLEYIPRGDRNLEKKIMINLKHFIGRAGLTEWELKMLYGLCWQIEKKVMKR